MSFRRIALLTFIPLAACSTAAPTPPFSDTRPAPVFSPIPTLTVLPATAPLVDIPPTPVEVDSIIGFDFVAELCNARWTNNGNDLPCPGGGDPRNSPDGYVRLYDAATLGVNESNSAILTYPAQNTFEGVFGRYPEYEVHSGDQFFTYVTCISEAPCDVNYALDYYDGNGGYHSDFASWDYRGNEPMKEVIVELSPLAGEKLEFVLALRPNNSRESAFALWIGPRIILTTANQ